MNRATSVDAMLLKMTGVNISYDITEVVRCTHASFTKMKDDAEEDPSASLVITSNSKVTVFNTNRVLATLVSRT